MNLECELVFKNAHAMVDLTLHAYLPLIDLWFGLSFVIIVDQHASLPDYILTI